MEVDRARRFVTLFSLASFLDQDAGPHLIRSEAVIETNIIGGDFLRRCLLSRIVLEADRRIPPLYPSFLEDLY